MRSKYQKYDIATKVSLVEQYLELSKTVKITKTDFAHQKGISDSTFNDWVIKYQKDKDRFVTGSNSNDDVSIVSYTKPSFIELTKDNVPSKIISNDDGRCANSIKLSYKDVTLEFNNDQLEMVLGIIRRWQSFLIRIFTSTVKVQILEKVLNPYLIL